MVVAPILRAPRRCTEVVELVDRLVARVVGQPAVDQFTPGAVHRAARARACRRTPASAGPGAGRACAGSKRRPLATAKCPDGVAAAATQRAEADVEIQPQPVAALRNAQARMHHRQRHQSAELVVVAREALVEITLQLRRGERHLVAEQSTERIQANMPPARRRSPPARSTAAIRAWPRSVEDRSARAPNG